MNTGVLNGGPGENRTHDLGIKSPLLCQLSYRPHRESSGGRDMVGRLEPRSCAGWSRHIRGFPPRRRILRPLPRRRDPTPAVGVLELPTTGRQLHTALLSGPVDSQEMTEQPRTLVAGGGSWGTALAALLSRQGVPTVLWAREEEVVDGINEHEENPLFLAGVPLPVSLRATSDLDRALAGADVVINAIPTQFIRSVFASRAGLLTGASLLISVSKGVEVGTLLTPSEVFEDMAPGPLTEGLVALSGPSFADEVARGTPTAVVVASRVPDNARRARDLVSSETFRAYSSDDLIGVEMGGALKNVMAIAAGIADGLGTGHNTRAAVITRGLAELARLGVAKGGHPLTFAGLSGIGDLVLTCTGDLSRNRRVGFEIGRGRTLEEVTAETNTVAEGVKTTLAARDLAQRLGGEMPITEQVYLTLYEDKDPRQVMMDLMTRQLRDER